MPVLQEGVTRIVLTWDENPRDLDSHVSGNAFKWEIHSMYIMVINLNMMEI